MHMESLEMDSTQLSKISINISRYGDGNFTLKSFKSETPPPSPLQGLQARGDTDSRPPHSYVRLVIMALLDRPDMQGTIKDIYEQITKMFPYYQENRLHWKNSVRHNLTLFSCFQRVAAADGSTAKGSYLWKLTGDWQTVLNRAEAAASRKSRLGSDDGSVCEKRRDRHPKSTRKDKAKHSQIREKELSKRKKREMKAKKLKLKTSYLHSTSRIPLAEFNFCNSPVKEERPLLSRMPTPPPKLPGVENAFLPPPTLSISPQERASDIWGDSPDLNIRALSFDEIANFSYDKWTIYDYSTAISTCELSSLFETDADSDVDRLPAWYNQYTPEPSPAKSSSDWANVSVTGYTPPSANTNLWDLVEPEVEGMMGLLTLDTEWMASVADDDLLIEL